LDDPNSGRLRSTDWIRVSSGCRVRLGGGPAWLRRPWSSRPWPHRTHPRCAWIWRWSRWGDHLHDADRIDSTTSSHRLRVRSRWPWRPCQRPWRPTTHNTHSAGMPAEEVAFTVGVSASGSFACTVEVGRSGKLVGSTEVTASWPADANAPVRESWPVTITGETFVATPRMRASFASSFRAARHHRPPSDPRDATGWPLGHDRQPKPPGVTARERSTHRKRRSPRTRLR